jgi:hypothetical protein
MAVAMTTVGAFVQLMSIIGPPDKPRLHGPRQVVWANTCEMARVSEYCTGTELIPRILTFRTVASFEAFVTFAFTRRKPAGSVEHALVDTIIWAAGVNKQREKRCEDHSDGPASHRDSSVVAIRLQGCVF